MTWNVEGSDYPLGQDQPCTHLPQADVPYSGGTEEDEPDENSADESPRNAASQSVESKIPDEQAAETYATERVSKETRSEIITATQAEEKQKEYKEMYMSLFPRAWAGAGSEIASLLPTAL